MTITGYLFLYFYYHYYFHNRAHLTEWDHDIHTISIVISVHFLSPRRSFRLVTKESGTRPFYPWFSERVLSFFDIDIVFDNIIIIIIPGVVRTVSILIAKKNREISRKEEIR